MLKLTKTGIGLLTKQYRSVLKKCLLLNLGLMYMFYPTLDNLFAFDYSGYPRSVDFIYDRYTRSDTRSNFIDIETSLSASAYPEYFHGQYFDLETFVVDVLEGRFVKDIQSLNYYYTFRNDKTVESAEFTLFLNNEKLSSVFEA